MVFARTVKRSFHFGIMIDYDKFYDEACDLADMQYEAVKDGKSEEAKELQLAFEQSLFVYRLLKAA